MPDDAHDMTLDLLRQIQAEQGAFRSDVKRRFGLVERRFDALESDMLEVKRALRGMTNMMATFTGRLEDVETSVDRLAPA